MSIELNYVRKGTGEPLILMHGIGHRWQAFEPIIDQLAEQFDVIAIDQAGFGNSPRLPQGTKYSIEALADAISANYARWGIEKPHVVGNSMGGSIAIVLGQTGRARSVTTLSPGGYFNPLNLIAASIPLTMLKVGAYLPKPLLKLNASTKLGRILIGFSLYRHPGRYDADRSYGDSLAMKGAHGFWPMYFGLMKAAVKVPKILTGAVKVPTTIGWGTRDILLLPSEGRRAVKLLTGSHLVPIPDAGHVCMGDNPDAVIDAIVSTAAEARAHTTAA